MRAVIQRVTSGSVSVMGNEVSRIERGFVVLVGVARGDGPGDIEYLADKVAGLRVFDDEEGKMNLNVIEAGGAVLAVSQFTLYGDVRKGRRPSFSDAAPADEASDLYRQFVESLKTRGVPVATGVFQAMMHVALVNDGPVTILLDSRRGF